MRNDLAGIRVVAVEQAVAAPLCSRHLADLGAEVVKVERPPGGDFARAYDSAVRGWSSHFVWLNRGKRSVVLDLKAAGGRAALESLLAEADVLVCNLAPGALDRIIPDDELARLNPRLVRCHLSGYGTSGPYADRKAYDALVQGEAGTIRATGTADQPAKPGVSMADVGGGVYALASILAALYERERTGLGKRLDVSLFGVLLEWMSPLLLAERYAGGAPPPAGLGHASIAPYGPYRCADGADVLVAVQNDGQWRRFCQTALQAPELLRPELATNGGRVERRDDLEAEIDSRVRRLSSAEFVGRLVAADVPFGRLNTAADVLAHPQAEATGRWTTAALPDGTPVVVTTSPLESEGPHGPEDVRVVPELGGGRR
jgi:crotonobetainyl-CoA:carnitine CoA-transferase CaiB-like acyl-CoA transferase